jgi:acyl carrier protein
MYMYMLQQGAMTDVERPHPETLQLASSPNLPIDSAPMRSETIGEGVHAILQARNRHVVLRPDLPLGADGVGLDSIALVEVLLECEETFGIVIAAEVLAGSALTVGSLIEQLQARVPA